MSFVKNLKNRIKASFFNKKISKYKYIHLMFNDKFNKPFVDFLNKNFDNNEHLILCKRWFKEHPFPEGKNVVEIKNLKNLDFSKNEKILCHSLFDNELIDYLHDYQDILKNKMFWIVWGGISMMSPKMKRLGL